MLNLFHNICNRNMRPNRLNHTWKSGAVRLRVGGQVKCDGVNFPRTPEFKTTIWILL